MSQQDVTRVQTPGVYGKLPCFGDFVVRRLPGEFTEIWDAWLQRGMAGLRDRLGGRWLEFYRVAPVWRFLLTPGIAGNTGWAGVLTPSVDRVGRYFPLTIAAPVSPSMDPPATLVGIAGWFDRIEPLARHALTVSLDFEHWDLQLRSVGGAPWIGVEDCLEQTIPLPRSRVPLLRVFLPSGSSADLQVTCGARPCRWCPTRPASGPPTTRGKEKSASSVRGCRAPTHSAPSSTSRGNRGVGCASGWVTAVRLARNPRPRRLAMRTRRPVATAPRMFSDAREAASLGGRSRQRHDRSRLESD